MKTVDLQTLLTGVALLTEGVDRNEIIPDRKGKPSESPSSRRAWIEIDESEDEKKDEKRRPPHGGRG